MQAAQLSVDLRPLLVEVPLDDGGLGEGVLAVGQGLTRGAGLRGDLEPAGREVLPGLDRVQARLLEQVAEGRRARAPGVTVVLATADLPLDVGEPVAAVPGPPHLQVSFLLPERFQGCGQVVLLGGKLDPLRLKGVE